MEEKIIDIEFKKIKIEKSSSESNKNDIISEKKSVIKYVNRETYIKEYNIPIKKEYGDLYENYILNYLIEEKKYKAWLWNDIPKDEFIEAKILNINDYNKYIENARKRNKNKEKNNPLQDVGIDILAKNNNEYIFVQCKNNISPLTYSSNLTGFFMFLSYHIDKKGILFFTSKLNSNIEKYLVNNERIKFILKPFDIKEYQKLYKNKNTSTVYIDISKEYVNNIDTYVLDEYKIWNKNIKKLQNFIDINKKLPTTVNDSNEKKLHNWYKNEQKLYEYDDYKWPNEWSKFLKKNNLQSNFDKHNKYIDTLLDQFKNDHNKVKKIMTYYKFK
jgi:hypothetical protein